MGEVYDFSGYATRNDIRCSDGRTIRKDAFADNDGQTVPLVYQHIHNDVTSVLGHGLLENRDDGVYVYGKFNNTDKGRAAKEMVRNGDIKSLSIYANNLKQQGGNVLHGSIREVSLVLAGANKGAYIDMPIIHGDEMDVEEAYIYMDYPLDSLAHADKKEDEPPKEEKKEEAVAEEKKEKTIGDIIDSLTEEQKEAVYFLIGKAAEEGGAAPAEDEEVEHYDMGGTDFMKHNVFDDETRGMSDTLSHDEMSTIFNDAKRFGTLKESFLAHADEYGIQNIDWLFPEAKQLETPPGFIKRNPDAWVDVVMNGVHHTPFSRIKMMFADLRGDDARAKGYAQKGKLKKEEVFGLLRRSVEPTTIYKKQKLDRDDIADITDFDVVAWLKGEMRMMLDEEIARAILFGDGRAASDEDKIREANIIPIVNEASLYKIEITPDSNSGEDIIDACVKAQDDYEGSGNLILFTSNKTVTKMLLVKDLNKHRMYKDMNELAMACSVNRIVKVPETIVPAGITGVIVDLNDYNIGADKGGAVNMFDDFDIDYNQQKYLIETRCSGALTKPFSAMVIKQAAQGSTGN